MLKSTCKAIILTALVGTSTGQVSASVDQIESATNTSAMRTAAMLTPATLEPSAHAVAASTRVNISQEMQAFFQKLPTELQAGWQRVIAVFDNLRAAAPALESDATAILSVAKTIAALGGKTDLVADLIKAQTVVTGAYTTKLFVSVNAQITMGTTIVDTLEPVLEPLVNALGTPPATNA